VTLVTLLRGHPAGVPHAQDVEDRIEDEFQQPATESACSGGSCLDQGMSAHPVSFESVSYLRDLAQAAHEQRWSTWGGLQERQMLPKR
jgi:hypothetical protein